MSLRSKLNPKKRYLQIALNSTLDEAYAIINDLPVNDRIIIETGTPLIKRYGEKGIRQIVDWYTQHVLFGRLALGPRNQFQGKTELSSLFMGLLAGKTDLLSEEGLNESLPVKPRTVSGNIVPYVVADLKTMDRAEAEVAMAARAGASAAVALGTAPIETLNSFVEECERHGIDAMIDMMNVDFPLSVLRALKKVPPVIILHRGVDEEKFNREKMIPLHEIRRIKGNYDIMISIAGGDKLREVQSSVFNDADIVVIWKSVYQKNAETIEMVEGFLKQIK